MWRITFLSDMGAQPNPQTRNVNYLNYGSFSLFTYDTRPHDFIVFREDEFYSDRKKIVSA
jgi:hypothetical protein